MIAPFSQATCKFKPGKNISKNLHINVKTANIFVMIHNFPIFVPAVCKSDDAISEPLS